MACANQHAQLQQYFPGPTFKPDLESMYFEASTNKQEEKMTRQALRYVNSFHEVHTTATWTNSVHGMCIHVQLSSFRKKIGHSVTASATALCPELRLHKKPSQSEVLATKQKRDNESIVLVAIVPRQILGDSIASVSSQRREESSTT